MSALACGKRSQSTLFEDEFLSPLPSSKRIRCSAALHFSPPTSAVLSPQPPPIDHLRCLIWIKRQPTKLSLFGVIYFAFELAAIHCLKMKRLYEQCAEHLVNFQLRIHDQMIMLEGAKATTETVDALTIGADAMKAMQKAICLGES